MGVAPKTATEPTLFGYVIAYLQEEYQHRKGYLLTIEPDRDSIQELVRLALDAYAGGARDTLAVFVEKGGKSPYETQRKPRTV